MSKLIFADIPRVLKSKLTLIVMILIAFMGIASVVTVLAEVDFDAKDVLLPMSSSSFAVMMCMLLPVFSGGLSILLIAGEFSSGIIRNKFIMGHERRSILFSWAVLYSVTTLVEMIVYFSAYFITLAAFGANISSDDAKTIVQNLALMLLFSLKFQMFSLLMVCIYPDAKTAVICYILNNITVVPLMLLGMSEKYKDTVAVLGRFFLIGFAGEDDFTLLKEPDKAWLTAICTLSLGAVYLLLAFLVLRKKDLK